MNDTAMWLFPLPIAAILILFLSLRAGWRWTWGVCLQQSIILLVTIAAFYFLYAPHSFVPPGDVKVANYLTLFAWIMFFAFNFGQRMVVNALTLDLTMWRIKDARARLPMIHALAWGPPVKYWTDIVKAVAFYQDENNAAADAIFDRWRSDPRIPAQSKDGMLAYALLGRVRGHDWDGIIQLFLACRRGEATGVPFVPVELVSRAFLEQHKYDESFRCMRAVLETSPRITPDGIDMYFLPFFALCGATDKLQAILDRCKNKRSMPDYVRLLWLGRCNGVAGNTDKALQLLAEAETKTPPELTVWHDRIRHSIDAVGNPSREEPVRPADPALIDAAWRAYTRWRSAADIMRPTGVGVGLGILMVALAVAFIVANFYTFFHSIIPLNAQVLKFEIRWLEDGQLNGDFWRGQWWRAITYMFLHGNTPHLALNLGALFLFGRPAERMYGTGKFFLIFFLTGILSGMFQLLITPNDPAVGASGAIFGVFGAATAGLVKLKSLLPAHLRKSELKWMVSIALLQVLFDQTINKVAEATDKSANGIRIAAFAHLGGMVAGFIIGIILPLKKRDSSETVDISGHKG
ncbi:MAG TPA: rhomboid family intramembrane serine protease [Candidatus Obscuribacterales bacterium]